MGGQPTPGWGSSSRVAPVDTDGAVSQPAPSSSVPASRLHKQHQSQQQQHMNGHQQQPQQQPQPQQLDTYGFSLEGLTPQQRADRAACASYAARRSKKWQPFVERQELPTGAVLKRYCRKVSGVGHVVSDGRDELA